jgi:hypothetical protein
MKKSINVKPVTELELQFEDGKVICVVIDTKAFFNLGALKDEGLEFSEADPLPEQCAKMVYAGAKSKQPDVTYEEVRAMVSDWSMGTITDIIFEFADGATSTKNGVQSELQKKLMELYAKQISK